MVRKLTWLASKITRRRIVAAAKASRIATAMNAMPSRRSDATRSATIATTTAAAATTAARRTRAGSTSELVNATIAVSPAIATAATRPAQPSGGSVIITTNVMRTSNRTRPYALPIR